MAFLTKGRQQRYPRPTNTGDEQTVANADAVSRTRDWVRKQHAGLDGSHDFQHVERVWALAKTLGASAHKEHKSSAHKEVGESRTADGKMTSEDWLVLELAALLHDVDDKKYLTEDRGRVPAFLQELFRDVFRDDTDRVIRRILFVIEHVSFRTEAGMGEDFAKVLEQEPLVLPIVQDADRIDAIGALGVARCFCFGGSRDRALYTTESLKREIEKPPPSSSGGGGRSSGSSGTGSGSERRRPSHGRSDGSSSASASANSGSAVNKDDSLSHFYDKLFTLRDRIKTHAGRRMAEERHQFMLTFVQRLKSEVAGVR